MKKVLSSISLVAVIIFLSIQTSTAQTAAISSIVTDTLIVNGDCGMCKKKIETACFGLKSLKSANWDDEKLTLIVSYDPKSTSADAILKRVALVGYDNEKYKAADKAYFKLHGCCQYDRTKITAATSKKN